MSGNISLPHPRLIPLVSTVSQDAQAVDLDPPSPSATCFLLITITQIWGIVHASVRRQAHAPFDRPGNEANHNAHVHMYVHALKPEVWECVQVAASS